MKKILMLSVFCGIFMLAGGAGFASPTFGMKFEPNVKVKTGICGETNISFDGNQNAGDDEFLYSTEAAYLSIKDSSDGGTVSGGLVYECDNRHCAGGKQQRMSAGHVFDGRVVNEDAVYICKTGVTDKWERVYEGCQYGGRWIAIGAWYVNTNGDKVILDYARCSQFQDMSPSDYAKKFYAKCEKVGNEVKMLCYPVEGQPGKPVEKKCTNGGDEKITNQKDCSKNQTFECKTFAADKKSCICGVCNKKAEDGGESGVVGKCHPSVCKSEVCKACCAKPSSETVWDRSAQVCQCMNGGKFTKENNQWICKVDSSQVAGPKEDCDPTLLAKVKDWVLQCSSYLEKPGADELVSELDRILEYCKGQNVKNDVFLRLYDDLKEMVDKVCVESTVVPQPVEDNNAALIIAMRKRITSAADVLDSIRSGFKVSVWKDEKGNFNTSRLVSDSVAGVVLGTAGGLITSNIVKKNQIEDGFEDIQCTVGGQVVSNWGDEFRVGIQ